MSDLALIGQNDAITKIAGPHSVTPSETGMRVCISMKHFPDVNFTQHGRRRGNSSKWITVMLQPQSLVTVAGTMFRGNLPVIKGTVWHCGKGGGWLWGSSISLSWHKPNG